jgi:hypothetical protein
MKEIRIDRKFLQLTIRHRGKVDESRGLKSVKCDSAVKSIHDYTFPPTIEARIPSQPACKGDIAPEDLIDEINALTVD